MNKTLIPGQIVYLDKGFAMNSEVEVVKQTPKKLYTTVTSNGVDTWEVMTYRLTKKLI